MIAVGASIAANCQACVETNIVKAREGGAEAEEIAAAVEVGKKVRQGAADKMDRFVAGLNPAALSETGTDGMCCGCEKP